MRVGEIRDRGARSGQYQVDTMVVTLKGKFIFLHMKPYNKDSYDHIRCSTALL